LQKDKRHITNVKGLFIVRTNNEKVMTVEDVCDSLQNRGGFSGDREELLDHVRKYYKELVYLLCNGFAVNSGFYTLYLNIGGTFDSAKGVADREKHPITLRLRVASFFKALLRHVEIYVEGEAETNGFIHQFFDAHSETTNDSVTGGEIFVLTGDRIKIAGDHADVGVYFELTEEPFTRIKVQRQLGENFPSKVVGIVPMLLAPKSYRVVVVTQFSSGATLLKAPKTITSNFEVDAE